MFFSSEVLFFDDVLHDDVLCHGIRRNLSGYTEERDEGIPVVVRRHQFLVVCHNTLDIIGNTVVIYLHHMAGRVCLAYSPASECGLQHDSKIVAVS